MLKQVDKTTGDTSFEELECVGLDNNTDHLVETFRVKRPNGFSGGPCTAGSTEFVSYWADFGDTCMYSHLGTVQVNTHDYDKFPAGGLCEAAPLPVDLGAFRRDCDWPVIGRVRAVLSWGASPSTTDPDAVPHWGNRLDVHVQLRPGRPYDGTARFTIVGGVGSASVDLASGLTLPGAAIAENGYLLPNDCPFAGVVTLHGPLDQALAGQLYRVRVRNVTTGGGISDLTGAFFVSTGSGSAPGPRREPAAGRCGRAGWATRPGSSGTSRRPVTTGGRCSWRCSASASSTYDGCRWTTPAMRRSSSGTPTTPLTCTSTPSGPAGCHAAGCPGRSWPVMSMSSPGRSGRRRPGPDARRH